MIDRRHVVRGLATLAAGLAMPALAQDVARPPTFTMVWLQQDLRAWLLARPDVVAAVIVPPDGIDVTLRNGRRIQLGLSNTLLNLQGDPARWREIIAERHRALDGIFASVTPPAAPEVARLENLLIAMRHDRVFLDMDRRQPGARQALIARHFFGPVRSYVVVDSTDTQRYLTRTEDVVTRSSPDACYTRALSNTEAKFSRVRMRAMGEAFLIDVDQNYNSSILLVDKFWRMQEERLGGPVAVAAPARDIVVFAKPAELPSLRRMFERLDGVAYPAADGPLIYSQGRWRAA
jgi:hypothetical protein